MRGVEEKPEERDVEVEHQRPSAGVDSKGLSVFVATGAVQMCTGLPSLKPVGYGSVVVEEYLASTVVEGLVC